MILNVSGRTDVCAFYSKWFMNRIEAGFFDVRNPFHAKHVSRIYLEAVDAFVFCTKNPLPMIPYLDQIQKPMLFHITLTGYQKDFEPHLPDKTKVVEGIKEISDKIGIENVYVRYDPIILSEKYDVNYHLRAYERLCTLLEGKVKHTLVSFLDEYKNVKEHADLLAYHLPSEEELRQIGEGFSKIAAAHGMDVFTCFEKNNLTQYGFQTGACLSVVKAYELTGKLLKKWKARDCGCVEMADIGCYNSCPHLCRYCYANFDEKQIQENVKKYDPNSSLLCSSLQPGDIIKERWR
jgi:hypothetical protein